MPGVGRKTANVVLNVAFGAPTLAVDTHVFRVANRIPLAKGKTPREVEDGLMKIIPARFMRHAHHWLILHGRYVCKARAPAVRALRDRRPLPLQGQDGLSDASGDLRSSGGERARPARRRRLRKEMVPPPRLERGTSRSTI